MMKKTTILSTIAVCVILLLHASCSHSSRNSSSDQTLKLGVMSSMDYLPLAVAQREGYFEKVGLSIKLQKFYSANDRDAAFQSENIDGSIIDYTGAILQKSGGIDLRLTSKCDAPFYIIASSQSNINTLADLKGKQIAVSRNTVIDFITDMALKSADLTDTDVKKVEINKIPVRFEMLRNNKIDATGLPNPFALIAENAGDRILTSNDSLGFSITGIIFHQKVISEKSALITKMYEAYNMGVDYLKSHSAEDVKDILIKELGFTESIISKTKLPNYTYAQLPNEKDITAAIGWLKNKELIKSDFDQSSFLDNQFIKK